MTLLIRRSRAAKVAGESNCMSGYCLDTEKQFEVTWDGKNNAINLISNKHYTAVGGELSPGDGTDKTAILNSSTIYLNGQSIQLTAYTINNNNYFKLRDVGQAFDFNVSWDGVRNTIVVNTSESYTAD